MMIVRELHKRAMDLAELAFIAKLEGERERFLELTREALRLEAEAAWVVPIAKESEPTRAILFRSAASLAMDCDALAEAERLIAGGLSGYPPEEIAEELRELLETLYSKRAGEKRQKSRLTPRSTTRLHLSHTDTTAEERWVEATGELRYAKSTKQDEIGIIEEDGTFHRILVQEGLDDIVTSLWNEQVQVSGLSDGEVIKLVDIRQV